MVYKKKLYDAKHRLPTDIELIEPFLGIRLRPTEGHHPAVDWRDIPHFVSFLYREQSVSSKALLFAILTASRSQTVREACWGEIKFSLSEWQIPAKHMKGKQGNNQPHVVPLSNQALQLLRSMRPQENNTLIFSSTGSPLSGTALRKVIHKLDSKAHELGTKGFRDIHQNNRIVVPHGFRATFATWAQENEEDLTVVELCLAHRDSSDRNKGAYRRGRMMKQRQQLLQRWADYCFSAIKDASK